MSDRDPQPGFHYSREERLASRPEKPEQPRGLFKRNRSLAITLLDVSLVLLMFLLYLFLFRPAPGNATFESYDVNGTAFLFDDGLYVTITTELTDDESLPPTGADSLVTLEWPDGTSDSDVLPVDAAFPTVTRKVIPWDESDETIDQVSVAITIQEESDSIDLRIRDR